MSHDRRFDEMIPQDDRTTDVAKYFAMEQPRLRAYIRSIVFNPSDVDDVLQDVAVTAIQNIGRFDTSRPVGAWVLGIARNRVLKYLEKRRTQNVFEGRAEATASESSTKILMNAGDAVAIVKSPNTAAVVNRISANEAYFSKSIESMNHLPIVNGDIELLTSPPRSVKRIASELVDLGRASLFAEQQSVELTDDLSVTWTDPGRCPELEGLNQTIAAGNRVDSFLVSFTMPRKLRRSKEHVTADGTIKFDRPVLGIICFEPGKVDSALQAPSTTYPGDRRTGLEDMIDGNPAWADQISLSDDRQTLSFHLDLHGRDAARQEDFIDQFRVLVQSQPSP